MPAHSIDDFDRRILQTLQIEGRLSNTELAGRIGLSDTPCLRRLKRLEQDGIIQGYRAVLDRAAIGLGLTVFIMIEALDHSPEWLQRFTGVVSGMPEVMEVHRMAGDVDYLLRVAVADMAAFDAFYRRLIEAVPLKNVSSHFAMERVKSTTAFPIDAA